MVTPGYREFTAQVCRSVCVCGNCYSQPEAAVTYPLYHIIHNEFLLRIQLCLGGKRLTFKTIKDFI